MNRLVVVLFVMTLSFGQDTDSLPSLREDSDTTAMLQKGEPFFPYKYELDALKNEIDSLKQVIQVYQKRKAIPEIDPRLLELIQKPEMQHRIMLENGTVVLGEIIQRSDKEIIVRTQLGKLVIDAQHVTKIEEEASYEAKVEWVGEPSIQAYPTKEIIKGRVKNTGQVRADFVRIIAHLWTSTTEETGVDSAFVDGKEYKYESGVISDTMLEPGQTAAVTITVAIPDEKMVSYRTYDIRWLETK